MIIVAEFTANIQQVVNPSESIIFTANTVPCRRNLINFIEDTGAITLKGYSPNNQRNCPCCRQNSVNYLVDFGANIAIPTGGTVGAISLAITIAGTTLPASTMIVTPAAVEQFFSVSRAINAAIFSGCCESLSVRNTSNQPLLVQNANIIISRPDLAVSR